MKPPMLPSLETSFNVLSVLDFTFILTSFMSRFQVVDVCMLKMTGYFKYQMLHNSIGDIIYSTAPVLRKELSEKVVNHAFCNLLT